MIYAHGASMAILSKMNENKINKTVSASDQRTIDFITSDANGWPFLGIRSHLQKKAIKIITYHRSLYCCELM